MDFKGWIDRTFIALIFGILLSNLSICAAESNDNQQEGFDQLQKQLLEKLAFGQDPAGVLRQLKSYKKLPARQPLPPQNRESHELEKQLKAFRQLTTTIEKQGKLTPVFQARLVAAYESLLAHHLMIVDKFGSVAESLTKAGLVSVFEERRSKTFKAYSSKMEKVFDLLEETLGKLHQVANRDELLANVDFNQEVFNAVRKINAYLESNSVTRKVTILRNNLPYRHANYSQRQLTITPAIVPSYQQTTEVASQIEDLAATLDAPLDEVILKQAKALEYDYIRIYEFVRHEVKTEWYASSMKGAVGTLEQMSGNDVDQANLLIALFRASGLPARYVRGVIDLPINWVMESLGVSDPEQAVQALSRSGLAYQVQLSGNQISSVQIEHIWVAAKVPYTNYRGAMVDASGKTWIPLAPALKHYQFTSATTILDDMGFNAEAAINDYLQSPQLSDLVASIRKQVTDYVTDNLPEQTYEQQLAKIAIKEDRVGLMPNSLPVDVVAVTDEMTALKDSDRQQLRLIVRQSSEDDGKIVLDHTVPVSQIASHRLTLSYQPATVDDQKIVNLFGGLDNVPVYLVKLRPQFKIDGQQKAVAEDAVDMGVRHLFELQIISPSGMERVAKNVIAGGYHAVAVAAQQSISVGEEDSPADTEYDAARLLYSVAQSYTERWYQAETELSALMDIAVIRAIPSIAITSNDYDVSKILGLPQQMTWTGVSIDAVLRAVDAIARNGDSQIANNWMRLSALHGSTLEHAVFEDLFLVESVSADKGIQLANEAGVPVLSINSGNSATLLPTLDHPAEVISDIDNWVRQGMSVDVPQTIIGHNDWQGSVWRVTDPNTGGGGYFIAGGLAGGQTAQQPPNWLVRMLGQALALANQPAANNDAMAGATISIVSATDGQIGTVGEEYDNRLAVQVRDKFGGYVAGAKVTFVATTGGKFLAYGAEHSSFTVTTDAGGFASVRFKSGKVTQDNPVYLLRKFSDEHVTQSLWNRVNAYVETRDYGFVSINKQFELIGHPGEPTKLVTTHEVYSQPSPSPKGWGILCPMYSICSSGFYLQVQDEYNNSISNVSISFGMEPDLLSADLTGTIMPKLVDTRCTTACANMDFPASMPTTYIGRRVSVWMGDAREAYVLTAQATGTGMSIPAMTMGYVLLGSNTDLKSYSRSPEDEFGNPIAATKYGEVLNKEVEYAYGNTDENGVFHPKPDPFNSTFEVTNGGKIVNQYVQDYIRKATVAAGPTPNVHQVNIVSNLPDIKSIVFYGLDLNIIEIASFINGGKSDVIMLNEDGMIMGEGRIKYNIDPVDYHPLQTGIDIFKSGVWDGYIIGSSRTTQGEIIIPSGYEFDVGKQYKIQLVVNRGNKFEVRGARKLLPLRQKIFKQYERMVNISMDVDIANERTCQFADSFSFSTTQPAKITLKFYRIGSVTPITIIDDEFYSAGDHSVVIKMSDLSAGDYRFELSGESEIDSHIDTEDGIAISRFNRKDRMPVGHTTVEGVDVFDGSMARSSTDISIPSRGQDLEFTRTYSSAAASGMPGPLGYGWNHRYNSKIVVNPCGEVTVIGGGAGGVTFVDDGAGGLKPLKGYHSTLIANELDSSFDFYSKDGTHYHYRNFGFGAEWNLEYIVDTNGNVTKLGYDPGNSEVAKLITVEGPGGRTLTFNWEDKALDIGMTPLIARIDGPDGIVVEYKYDDEGNLESATRGDRVETYTYINDPLSAVVLQHKMLSATDAKGATVNYSFLEGGGFEVSNQGADYVVPFAYVSEISGSAVNDHTFEFDFAAAFPRSTIVSDARSNSTNYSLNSYGSTLSITDPVGVTQMEWATDDVLMTRRVDANGIETTYDYDTDGNLLEETVQTTISKTHTKTFTYASFTAKPWIKNRVKTSTDRNGKITTTGYDTNGNVKTIQDPEGGLTEHVYASNGDRIRTKDPNNNITKYTYDGYGNLDSVTDAKANTTLYKYDERSRRISMTDPLANEYEYSYNELDQLIKQTDPYGNEHLFSYDHVGNKLTETDEEGRITKWSYDGKNRIKTITNALNKTKTIDYDGVGNKISETDWNGVAVTFDYNEGNQLIKKTEPLGRITTFVPDPVGNVKSETDALAHTTSYEYDGLNRRTKITNANDDFMLIEYDGENKTIEQDYLGRQTSFAYDDMNRLTTVTEPLGRITQFKYDLNGNKIEEIDPLDNSKLFTYDELNRLVRITDREGFKTQYEYDANGNQTKVIDARLSDTVHEYDKLNRKIKTTDPAGYETKYGYDKVGNLVREEWANGNIIINIYDDLNRHTSSTDTIGPVVTKEYDDNGNVLEETDANSNLTTHEYDDLNQLTKSTMPESRVTEYGYDLVGNRTSVKNPRLYTTQYAYDNLNRLEKVIDPDLNTIEYTYDAVGNKKSEKDKRDFTTNFDYDDLNRLTTVTDPLTQVITNVYDLNGNLIRITDKRDIVTENQYDNENRPTVVIKDGVTISTTEYDEVGNVEFVTDANGNKIAYLYNERNLVTTESLPLAAVTTHQYDSMGDRKQTRDPEGRIITKNFDLRRRLETETNGELETTTYGHDGNGNRISMRRPNGNTWTYSYDGADRLQEVTDPLLGKSSFGYDANGNLESQTNANLKTTTHEYDKLDRKVATIYPDTARQEYGYDANGNLTRLLDPKGQEITYQYDELNRQTLQTYPLPTVPTGDDIQTIATSYDANNNPKTVTETYSGATGSRVTTNLYDNFDRLTSTTDAFNKTISYTYDPNGNRKTVKDPDGLITGYTYDALNRVEQVTNAGGVTNYSYDRSSLKTKVSYPNGTDALYDYDNAYRTKTITNRHNATTVSSYSYTFDDNGNRKTQIEENGGAAETTSYNYDDNDRLEQVIYPDVTTTYTYDAAYNRKTEISTDNSTNATLVDKGYDYDDRNQLETVTDNLDNSQNVTYQYDDNGNQVIKTKNGVTNTFIYDVRDKLIELRQDAATLGNYFYDYKGMRVIKTDAGGEVRYSYDGDSVLTQSDNGGTTIAKYDYGSDRLLSLNHSIEGRQFYLFDALGSTVNLTNDSGSIQVRYQYDAWGHYRSQTGSSWNRFAFTGHEKDEESGLYYFKARYYDPDTGRFLSQDSYLGEAGTPPSLHRYLYAYSNPGVYVDLLGYANATATARPGAGPAGVVEWTMTKHLQTDYQGDGKTVAEEMADNVRDAWEGAKNVGEMVVEKWVDVNIQPFIVEDETNIGTSLEHPMPDQIPSVPPFPATPNVQEIYTYPDSSDDVPDGTPGFNEGVEVEQGYVESYPDQSNQVDNSPYLSERAPGGTGKNYDKENGQGLYVLIDYSGNVKYVGRGDVPSRFSSHANDKEKQYYQQVPLWENNLSMAEAKGLEQRLMDEFGKAKSANPDTGLLNKIRSYADSNLNAEKYRAAATDELFNRTLEKIK